jgi:hypothetical protein
MLATAISSPSATARVRRRGDAVRVTAAREAPAGGVRGARTPPNALDVAAEDQHIGVAII